LNKKNTDWKHYTIKNSAVNEKTFNFFVNFMKICLYKFRKNDIMALPDKKVKTFEVVLRNDWKFVWPKARKNIVYGMLGGIFLRLCRQAELFGGDGLAYRRRAPE